MITPAWAIPLPASKPANSREQSFDFTIVTPEEVKAGVKPALQKAAVRRALLDNQL
jgi:hypothetical protein